MPIPTNKQELLSAIELNYAKLKEDLDTVAYTLANECSLEGHAKGTMMSIHNLVAYLVGWGELVQKWYAQKQAGQEPILPEKGYKWNELGALAQKFYKDYEAIDYNTLLEKLDQTVENLVLLIHQLDNAVLYDEAWYKQWTLGRLIQLNTASPYKNARTRVRKWKRTRLK